MRLRRHLSSIVAILLVGATPALHAQGGGTTISGRVTNEAGAPLPGASVFLQGLSIGSQTNDQGRYTFTVAPARATGQSATLTARVIGYAARSAAVTLTGGTTITQDFTLAANPLRLGEVVVTGAGTSTTRERLTTTINTVDSSAIHRVAQPQNVVSALAAQAPNVEVRTQSGEPGGSASIKIRGSSTVTGTNQPLFVVDGQPIDNQINSPNLLFSTGGIPGQNSGTVSQNRAADINPDDIQSIEILKGGAAAAIYGARAANGVILITTKSGRAGQTRITVSSTETWDRVYAPDLLQRTYGQGASPTQAAVCGGPDCALTRLSWGPALASGTPVYDHQADVFDTGLTADNSVQLSGGNDRTTFFASGALTNQDGYLKGPNNKYNRGSFRVKGTQAVGTTLNIGGNVNYVDDRGKYVLKGSQTSGVMLASLRTPPNFNNTQYLNANGTQRPFRFPNASSNDALNSAAYYDNPFFVLNNPGNRGEIGRAIANANGSWSPLAWLNVKETLGADYYNDWELRAVPITSATDQQGDVLRTDVNNLEIDHNLTAAASHSFGDNFDGTLTLGQNLNSRRYRYGSTYGVGLLAPEPFSLQNTLTQQGAELRSLQHIEAYFAQAEADLYHQLVVNVGVRNDGFSTFGASKRRNNFPKASAAWTFSNWLNGGNTSGWLSYGKLHVAYGETGKEPPVYAAVPTLTTQNLPGGGFSDFIQTTINGVGGIQSNIIKANAALRPERDRENEYGLDFALFNSRMDGSVVYYNKRSDDLILTVPVSTSATGAFFAVENGASVRNQGTEVSLNLHPLAGQTVRWDLGVQFGNNHGLVKSLAGTTFIPYNNEGFNGAIGSSTIGFAPGVIRGSDFIRCGRGLTLPDGSSVDAACGASANAQHALYLAANGQPIPDATDRVIADPNPKYTMSYSTTLKLWNKLTMSGLLDVRKGGSVWNGTRGILDYFGTAKGTLVRNTTNGEFGKNFLTDVYPHVAGPGAGVVAFKTPQDWENWFTGNGGGFGTVGAQFIEDGSFAKLREIGVTYTADQRWVRTLTGFSSADVRIAGRNLKTWTKYRGFDPEANLGGAEFLTQGLDYFNNPQTRSFVFSISLNR